MSKHMWKKRGTALLLSLLILSGSAMAAQEILVEDDAAGDIVWTNDDSANEPASFHTELPAAFPTPQPTGNDAADLIAVAKSQVGYDSGKYNSIYVQELGLYSGRWCSEFIRWCAWKAGTDELFPETRWSRSADHYVRYYSQLGRYYQVSGTRYQRESSKTIGLSEIQPGDIVIVDLDENLENGAEHTALVQSVAKDRVLCIDGNYGGCVKNVERDATWIHGVCRPNYQNSISSAPRLQDRSLRVPHYVQSMTYNTGAGIQLSWKKISGAKGYEIFRKSGKSPWECIGILDDAGTKYIDKITKSGTKYSYKVRAIRGTAASSFSKTKTMYRLEKQNIQLRTAKKKMTIAWDADTAAEGYQIQYAQNSSLSKGLVSLYIKGSKSRQKNIGGLRAGKTYYVRVRSYKYVSGTQYFSAWSDPASITVK